MLAARRGVAAVVVAAAARGDTTPSLQPLQPGPPRRACGTRASGASACATGGHGDSTAAPPAAPAAAAVAQSGGAPAAAANAADPPARHHAPTLTDVLSSGARLTTAAQAVWAQLLRPGDTAVDATCGNGHDTLFLAAAVGPSGRVHGFDIQEAAVLATSQRLSEALPAGARPAISLHCTCHSRLQEVCGSGVARVISFNLGYLPGADKGLTTRTPTTLAALEASLEVVAPGGVISCCCYTGHPGGLEEYEAVQRLIAELSPQYWVVSETRLLNRPTAPILLLVWRQDAPPPRARR